MARSCSSESTNSTSNAPAIAAASIFWYAGRATPELLRRYIDLPESFR